MGEFDKGYRLVQFLKECGVPSSMIIYPNTKWRMIYEVMFALSSSSVEADNELLYKIIISYLHPLNLKGNEYLSETYTNQFNQWLKYDNLEITRFNNVPQMTIRTSPKLQAEFDEQFDSMVDDETGQALHLIKEKYLEDIILLKKSYQLLLNIVNTFFNQKCRPTDQLNDCYLKICRIVATTNIKVFDDSTLKEFSWAPIPKVSNFWRPFNNLFSAASQYNGLPYDIQLELWRKMNNYYGQIVELCFNCDAGDILSQLEIQKVLNEISLYLTELKEERTNRNHDSIPTTQGKIVWSEDFRWEGDTFMFGNYGTVHFSSSERKTLFKCLTDMKGNWVTVKKLQGPKDANYVRATIRQIEERFHSNLKDHISIPSTLDDNAEPKPSQGAYRIKVLL